MISLGSFLRGLRRAAVVLGAASLLGIGLSTAQTATPPPTPAPKRGPQARPGTRQPASVVKKSYPAALVQSGKEIFQQNCSFCHGRFAQGGETGPDLTRSRLVAADVAGNKIGPVVHNGRPDKGMPRFDLSDEDIAGLVAFIHTRQNALLTNKGGRKGVDVSDLQTGNVEAGKQYFEGAGGCASCHSANGDLSGIASRLEGLELEENMLYPKHAKSKVAVTTASGQTVSGMLEYLDEFTVGLMDASGAYRSWRIRDVQYTVDAPVNAHAELLSKYSDDDIHNLMAYLQTLK